MRAILKNSNSKRILISQIDSSERALIEDFVTKSLKRYTKVIALYDIDNELDGASFELTDKKNIINFKTPCIQVIAHGNSTNVNLEVDSETNIEIDNDNEELEITLESDNTITIKAKYDESLLETTKQYVFLAILTKTGYEQAVVPINVSVLYIKDSKGVESYEELKDLPMLNDNTLIGNKSFDDIGLDDYVTEIVDDNVETLTNTEIDEALNKQL